MEHAVTQKPSCIRSFLQEVTEQRRLRSLHVQKHQPQMAPCSMETIISQVGSLSPSLKLFQTFLLSSSPIPSLPSSFPFGWAPPLKGKMEAVRGEQSPSRSHLDKPAHLGTSLPCFPQLRSPSSPTSHDSLASAHFDSKPLLPPQETDLPSLGYLNLSLSAGFKYPQVFQHNNKKTRTQNVELDFFL